MMTVRNGALLLLLMMMAVLFRPPETGAEFYRYVNEDGEVFYVDDLSKVPEQYHRDIKAYPEKYDHLPEEERLLMLRKERERDLQRMQEEIEAQKQRELEARQRRLETDVIIQGNQVLVPVSVGHGIKEVEALFLLDTGASHIVVFKDLAVKLNLEALKKGYSQVAGGDMIASEVTRLERVRVGPIERENVDAIIVEHKQTPEDGRNFSGLLGMNFLRNTQYTIDFENQKIQWRPPM